MPVLTEPKWPFEFIATEANGKRSRDNVTLASGQAAVLGPGRVLGIVTSSSKYTDLAPTASDGSQTAAGILCISTDATTADKTTVVVSRSCEVNRAELDFGALTTNQITAAITQLKALGIIVRPAI